MAKLLPLLLALGIVVIANATRYRIPHHGGDFPPVAQFLDEPHRQRLHRQPIDADVAAALHPGHHEHPEYPREVAYHHNRHPSPHHGHPEPLRPHVRHPVAKSYNKQGIYNYRRTRVPHHLPHDNEHHVEVRPIARPLRLGFDPSYGRRPNERHYYY
uniref:Histidine-rich glycoprotein n=1 Tax=Panagrellus redivivus TaxID=6233 RepID=A0A7E4ZSJ2_PANRE